MSQSQDVDARIAHTMFAQADRARGTMPLPAAENAAVSSDQPEPEPSPESPPSPPPAPIDDDALMRRITWRLLPYISFLYMLCFLDRINLSNVHGSIRADLDMSENDYSLAASIFFVGYILCELPSNLMLQRVQARVWIARILISWGAVTCAMAAVTSKTGLIALRLLLGACEAGFFPGVVFYLSLWYRADEIATRIAYFYSTSAVAGFVGGLVAYGVLQMGGVGGLRGWQWLFLLEGAPTVLSGVTVYYYLPNEPRAADFLSSAEQEYVERRKRSSDDAAGQTVSSKHISTADLRATLRDWRVWYLSALYLLVAVLLTGLSFFLPAILGTLGYGALARNLVSTPIYLIAACVTIALAWHSDRQGERILHCAAPACVAGIFFLLFALALRSGAGAGAQLVTLTVLVSSTWCLIPPLLGLILSLLKTPTSTASGTAVCVSLGNVGGLIGPALFSQSYTASQSYASACVALACCAFVFAAGVLWFRRRLAQFDFEFANNDGGGDGGDGDEAAA
jgi:sugar phosphate permease